MLYLACHPEKVVSVDEISRAFGISRHHLVKVVQTLTDLGVVEAQRGRGGGMRLAKRPSEINVGWLIRRTEPHFDLVECFDPEANTCPIAPACGLKGALTAPESVPGRPRRVQPRPVPDAAVRPGHPARRLATARGQVQPCGRRMTAQQACEKYQGFVERPASPAAMDSQLTTFSTRSSGM